MYEPTTEFRILRHDGKEELQQKWRNLYVIDSAKLLASFLGDVSSMKNAFAEEWRPITIVNAGDENENE